MLIRSASGLRGIAEDHFTPELIDNYISAFISTQNIKSCVIGRDGRPSGKQISQWVIDSFHKNGINVENCGLATTPTMQVMTEKEHYDGGIVITASHNPSEYNGLKFLQSDGTFLSPEQCEELFKAVDQNVSIVQPDSLGVVSDYSTANEEHIEKVLAAMCIDTDNIRKNKFKVVIDCVNGAGSFILPMLCEKLGCEVITINCNGNGDFTRIPEPLAENLNELEQKVLNVGADVGFATDPDGDRLSIVSNKGNAIGEEYTLVLAVKNYLNYQKSIVATNLSTSMMLESIANETIRTKIGEAHVVQKMNELNIQNQQDNSISWTCRHTWKRSSINTLWCLLGCSIGDFGTILFFQINEIPFPMLGIMTLAIINGLITSIILETIILSRQMRLKEAFSTATGMSLISMLSMEIAMNTVDVIFAGGVLVWWIIPFMLLAGFITPLPYNYYRLKKYNIACH